MTSPTVAPAVRTNAVGIGVSYAAVAVVLTYTTPTGKDARVVAAYAQGQGLTTEVDLEQVQSGGNLVIEDGVANTPSRLHALNLTLDAGEAVRWRVTALTAADTGDVAIYIEESN